ncbi:MAG TPA: hypothetical protein VNZ52_07175 [Candidatus Thermoplasmatota archaeon]|nr:hypothetical protein [Candidatus Thermoplasmatota archaeon]
MRSRALPSLVFLLLLTTLAFPLALGQEPDRSKSENVVLKPGESKEENMLAVEDGKEINYYFLTLPRDRPPKLKFDLHRHDANGQVVYLRQESAVDTLTESYRVDKAGDYSLLWTNTGPTPVSFTYTWSIRNAETEGPPAVSKSPGVAVPFVLAGLAAAAFVFARRP